MSKNDGGPAFPLAAAQFKQDGMSLRDWFAGQAMQATLSSDTAVAEIMASDMGATRQGLAKAVAGTAYLFADAMIAERSK